MQAELRAPNMQHELQIANPFAYCEKVDSSLKDDMENNTPIWESLDKIIGFEVARYVLFHTSGNRPFDQYTSDLFADLIVEEKANFKELSGKDYISHNNNCLLHLQNYNLHHI